MRLCFDSIVCVTVTKPAEGNCGFFPVTSYMVDLRDGSIRSFNVFNGQSSKIPYSVLKFVLDCTKRNSYEEFNNGDYVRTVYWKGVQ